MLVYHSAVFIYVYMPTGHSMTKIKILKQGKRHKSTTLLEV